MPCVQHCSQCAARAHCSPKRGRRALARMESRSWCWKGEQNKPTTSVQLAQATSQAYPLTAGGLGGQQHRLQMAHRQPRQCRLQRGSAAGARAKRAPPFRSQRHEPELPPSPEDDPCQAADGARLWVAKAGPSVRGSRRGARPPGGKHEQPWTRGWSQSRQRRSTAQRAGRALQGSPRHLPLLASRAQFLP